MASCATPVCEISNGGITTFRWLCPGCQGHRKDAGWSVKPTGKTADWPCDDCPAAPVEIRFLSTPADAKHVRRPATADAARTTADKGMFE